MNLADELQKLQQLHQTGALNDEEYARAKAKLLDGNAAAAPAASTATSSAVPPQPMYAAPAPKSAEYIEQQTRQWGMFLHLSQLLGFLIPFAGLIAPLIIWQVKKAELPGLDAHGKEVMNWILSALIYGVVSAILMFIVIGFLLLIALGITGLVFAILGGIKANEGIVWRYPLAIRFFS